MDSYTNYVKFDNDAYIAIPGTMQATIGNYLCWGLDPGSFTTAVLANDLIQASLRADHWNSARLPDIAKWIYYNAPDASTGSYERVHAWIADINEVRSTWFAEQEKARVWAVLSGRA